MRSRRGISRKRLSMSEQIFGQMMEKAVSSPQKIKHVSADETCASLVDVSRPCVVRLDGHCFSTWTRGFDRPYDLRIMRAMVGTATDLLTRFNAATAYTESDEISLLFPPSTPEVLTVPFKGRVQKICSVTAGFASARFNLHMCASAPPPGAAQP